MVIIYQTSDIVNVSHRLCQRGFQIQYKGTKKMA